MPEPVSLVSRGWQRVERPLLRRWHQGRKLDNVKLDLRLDMSAGPGAVRAAADLTFRLASPGPKAVLLVGSIDLHSATWRDRKIRARTNAPYLVLNFPTRLAANVDQVVTLRYTYMPDEHYTIQQPIGLEDCPERIWITCRRPLLGLVQGKLVEGSEKPPLRTYQWKPPRARRLNAMLANCKSFKKDTPSGMALWLHAQPASADRAPRLLDLLLSLYQESADSHHRELPYTDFHVLECDDPRQKPFNSPGLIVVPRGTFEIDDKPTVYGVLAPEFNKEWGRDPTRMVAIGKPD